MLVGDRRSAFLVAAPSAIVFGVGTFALLLGSGLDARQATAAGFVLVIAAGFVAAGLWVVARVPATQLGLLCVAIGCALFFACWVFADAPAAYTLGLLFGLIWAPMISHFVLGFPSGRLQR